MRTVASLLALVALGVTSPAFAFGNAESFVVPAVEGGGGGRFFTGSVADGYSCSVCHVENGSSGGRLEVPVSGVPGEGYTPSQSYTFTIDLLTERNPGAAIEVVDEAGRGAGRLSLPATLDADDRCQDPAETAALLWELDADRRVITLNECRARRLRVRWTAPASNVGPVWVNATVVSSNEDASPTGDRVFVFSRIVAAAGDLASPSRVESGCRATPGAGSGLALGALPLALLVLRRRRRVRDHGAGCRGESAGRRRA